MQSKPQQLAAARRLLKEASALIADAQGILRNYGEAKATERLKAIGKRLESEVEHVEQLQATQPS
jgi:hypothetical protein